MTESTSKIFDDIWPDERLKLEVIDDLPRLPYHYPNGWMKPIELKVIYNFAKRVQGPILEIGSWIGRSSCAIGAGVRDNSATPAPLYDIVDFGPASADEWKDRFGSKLTLEMGGGHVAEAVLHPGGSIAVLIDNLRKNDLLRHVTSIVRGDVLEMPLARRYDMIFVDAVHGEAEASRTMPKVAELAANNSILIFDDVISESFADNICSYIRLKKRFLLSGAIPNTKTLVVQIDA